MKSNNDLKELTQEELDKIAGGTIPTRPKTRTDRQYGIRCGYCSNMVPTSIQDILDGGALICPTCGLKIPVCTKKSLELIHQVQDKVDAGVQQVMSRKK